MIGLTGLNGCTCKCLSIDRLKCIKTPHDIALEQQPKAKFYKGFDSDRGKAGGLRTIVFADQSFGLTNQELSRVEQNAQILNVSPRVRVILEGFGDGTGSLDKDLELGRLRVKSVWRWLLKLGVSNTRITYWKRSGLSTKRKIDPESSSPKTHRVNFIIKNFDG